MMNKPGAWWTAENTAAYASVAVATVYRAARCGRLRGYKLNRARVWRFRLADVDQWLSGCDGAEARRVGEADHDDRG